VLSYLDWSSLGAARESVRRYRLFRRVGTHTLVSRAKLNTLCTLIRRLDDERVPGAIVECGVFKGGAAALMAHESSGRREVVLFDSFEGLPPPGDRDGDIAAGQYHSGWCAGTEDDVRQIFRRLGVLNDRVRLVKGWFDQTFPVTPVPPVALLHVDADWYDSVRLCLDTHFDRIAPGGYLVLDDYGRWEGCTRAADEFLASRGLGPLEPTGAVGHYLRKVV
jgi:O-methyltransferase